MGDQPKYPVLSVASLDTVLITRCVPLKSKNMYRKSFGTGVDTHTEPLWASSHFGIEGLVIECLPDNLRTHMTQEINGSFSPSVVGSVTGNIGSRKAQTSVLLA